MTKVIFVLADGSRQSVTAAAGTTLLRAAKAGEIEGVVGECNGSLSCGTCHVYVDPAWIERLPAPSSDEEDMLDHVATTLRSGSRLCCQIRITPDMDGLAVEVPHSASTG